MLIREELSDFIDVFLGCDHEKSVFQCRPLKVPEIDLSIVIHINFVEYSHDHCVGITILEFWGLLQEFKPWMAL